MLILITHIYIYGESHHGKAMQLIFTFTNLIKDTKSSKH